MSNYNSKSVNSWTNFLDKREEFGKPGHECLFRGQSDDWQLKTSLERSCEDYFIELKNAPAIEKQINREFIRTYRGSDSETVKQDTLYCLALMAHHGAPTRLLDWTFSPFVAAYFALESGGNSGVVWCMNSKWCLNQSNETVGPRLGKERTVDEKRFNDKLFKELYIGRTRRQFVRQENPFILNSRLVIQQGVFLCPGDISVPFDGNLQALNGWDDEKNITKLHFKMNKDELHKTLFELRCMNVSRETLFPGLDGFAQSLKPRMPFFEKQASRGVGTIPH